MIPKDMREFAARFYPVGTALSVVVVGGVAYAIPTSHRKAKVLRAKALNAEGTELYRLVWRARGLLDRAERAGRAVLQRAWEQMERAWQGWVKAYVAATT